MDAIITLIMSLTVIYYVTFIVYVATQKPLVKKPRVNAKKDSRVKLTASIIGAFLGEISGRNKNVIAVSSVLLGEHVGGELGDVFKQIGTATLDQQSKTQIPEAEYKLYQKALNGLKSKRTTQWKSYRDHFPDHIKKKLGIK